MNFRNLKHISKKALGIICAVAIIAAAIPSFAIFKTLGQTDGRTVYDFENGAWSEENTDGFRLGGTFKEGNDTLYYAINDWAPEKAMCEIINAKRADGTDSKVLKVYNNRDDGNRNYPVITLNDGDRPYKLEKDKQYTVSFKYKVVNGGNTSTSWMTLAKGVAVHSNSQVKMNAPVSAFDDNATPTDKANFKVISFTGSSVKQASGTIGVASPTQDVTMNEWHTFTATFKGGEWSNVHPYLAIYLDIQPGAEIYFDDFVIDTKSTVTFNANGGKISGKDSVELTGEIGAALSVSNPVKDGAEFMGWYTDTELTIPFDNTKFPAKDVTVYAKWSASVVKYYSFEPTLDGTNTITSGKIGDVPVTSRDTTDTSVKNKNQFSIAEIDGGHALKIAHNANNSWEVGTFLLNEGTKIETLTPGTTYTLSLRYRLENVTGKNADSGTNAWFMAAYAPNRLNADANWGDWKPSCNAFNGAAYNTTDDQKNRILSPFNNTKIDTANSCLKSDYKDINGQEVKFGEWNTVSYKFTVPTTATVNNYLAFAVCTIEDMVLYVDDVALVQDNFKAIVFDSNGGSSVKTISGTGDNAIAMPANPTKDNYTFAGWYTDKELNNKFTATKYSDLGILTHLYAKWVNTYIQSGYVFDFENGSTIVAGEVNGTNISSYAPDSADAFKNIYNIATEENGNKVLEIKHPEEYSVHYKNGCFILNKNGIIPELEVGKQYTVSMRVKINSLNTAATARVAFTEDIVTNYTANYGEFGNIYGDSSIFAPKYTAGSRKMVDYLLIRDIENGATPVKDINNNEIPVGQWVTITKTFTAYPNKTNGNLYVGFTSCTGINFSMYIDDIRFSDNSQKVVSFNTNGGTAVEAVYGNTNDEIVLPVTVREGYEFDGWYTDSALTKKAADPYKIGNSNVTLYAKWKAVDTSNLVVNFETAYTEAQTDVSGWSSFGGAFFLNRDGQKSHGQLQFSQDGCYDGSSSLLIKYSGTSNYSSALLRNSAKPNGLTAAPGEKVSVTLKYKAASGDISGAKLFIATAEKAGGGWYAVTRHSNYGAYLKSSASNGWQEMTFIYKNETQKTQYLHLGIDVTGASDRSNASVYIDHIAVQTFESDTTIVTVDYQDNANVAYLFGKEGAALNIKEPAPREGYRFIGFATDSKGENKFTATTFPKADTNVYGIWQLSSVKTGFENYPNGWTEKLPAGQYNQRFSRYAEISSAVAHSGEKSLRIAVTADLKSTDYVYVALDHDLKNLTLQNNTKFSVSFYYYAENLQKDLNVYLATATPASIWGGLKQYSSNTYSVRVSDVGAGWKKGNIIFESNLTSDEANALYLMISNNSNPTSVYFDDITVETIPEGQSVVTFVRNDGSANEYSIKNYGSFITFPEMGSRDYYNFAGWYKDAKFTTKYNGAVHPETDLTLYAKWDFKPGVKINVDFENYNLALPSNTKITTADKSGGSKSLYFDCGEKGSVFSVPLNLGDEYLTVSNGQRFAVSFDYKLNAVPIDSSKQLSFSFFTATSSYGSAVQQKFNYNYQSNDGMRWWIRTYDETHVWNQFSDTVTIDKADNGNILYFVFHQGDQITGYVDNITITPLAEDDVVVSTQKYTTNGKPYYIGKKGQTCTLDKSLTRPGNYVFVGWFDNKSFANEVSSFKFSTDTKVFAAFAIKEIKQGFESYSGIPGVKMMGSDFEVYNSTVKGFNKANVHSGSTSIHRIGNSHQWQNIQVLESKLGVTRYKVEFWVKMDSSLHTDGSIQISSAQSLNYPYDKNGEYFDVIAIKDLSDGEWHKVSYVFDSLSSYFNIRTPGYCSLYFDDVVFTYMGDGVPISTPVTVETQYEALKRNSDGTIADELVIKDTTLVSHKPDDSTSGKVNASNIGVLLAIILGSVGVVLVIAAVVVLIVLKRKGKLHKKAS